jgi:hypothetical protein
MDKQSRVCGWQLELQQLVVLRLQSGIRGVGRLVALKDSRLMP